jgi:hypothetical protein
MSSLLFLSYSDVKNVVTQTTAVVLLVQASEIRIIFTTPVESRKGNAFKPEMKVTVRGARSRT